MNITDLMTQLHSAIPPVALWGVFALALLLSTIMTFIFFYHWDRYGTNSITTFKLKAAFLIGVLSFLSLAVFSLINY